MLFTFDIKRSYYALILFGSYAYLNSLNEYQQFHHFLNENHHYFRNSTEDFVAGLEKCKYKLNVGHEACLVSEGVLSYNPLPEHWLMKPKGLNRNDCKYVSSIIQYDPLQLTITLVSCVYNSTTRNGGSNFVVTLEGEFRMLCETQDFFNNSYLVNCDTPPISYCTHLVIVLQTENYDAFQEQLHYKYNWMVPLSNPISSEVINRPINTESGKQLLKISKWDGWKWDCSTTDDSCDQKRAFSSNSPKLQLSSNYIYTSMSHNNSIIIEPSYSLLPENIIDIISGHTSSRNSTYPNQHSSLNHTHHTIFIGSSHMRNAFDYTLYLTNPTKWRQTAELYNLFRKHSDAGLPNGFSFEWCTDVLQLLTKIQRICNTTSSSQDKSNTTTTKIVVVIETGSHDLSLRGSAILYDIGLKKVLHYLNHNFKKKKEKYSLTASCENVYFIFWTLVPMPADISIPLRGMRNEGPLLAFSQYLKESILHINSSNVRLVDTYNIISPWANENVCGPHYICISTPPRTITNWTLWDTSTNCSKLGFVSPLLWCPQDFLVTRAGDMVIRRTLDEMNDIMLSW